MNIGQIHIMIGWDMRDWYGGLSLISLKQLGRDWSRRRRAREMGWGWMEAEVVDMENEECFVTE